MSESIREKILKVLLESTSPTRFTDLYTEAGEPSKGHFSQELHKLQREGLVIRDEIDYKHVEYSLNRKVYEAHLLLEQQALDEKMRKAKRNQT
jgi:DNA-binding HxlR family transcriptional regulator